MAGKKALNQQICCESDLLKTKKNIAPQSRGGRQVCAPHHTNVCKSNIAVLWGNIFAVFGCFTFKLGRLPYFKALYRAVLMDIGLNILLFIKS